MSASKHATAFCREVLASGDVFLIEHETRGLVDWPLAGGRAVRPVWSSRKRVSDLLDGSLGGPGRVIARYAWAEFSRELIPACAEAGLLVGINWAGPRVRGYNLDPRSVVERVEVFARERNLPLPVARHERRAG